MGGDGSRRGAEAQRVRRMQEPDRTVFVQAFGEHVVNMMEDILALPPEFVQGAESLMECTTVDGHSWAIQLTYQGFSQPQGLRGFAASREERDGSREGREGNKGAKEGEDFAGFAPSRASREPKPLRASSSLREPKRGGVA